MKKLPRGGETKDIYYDHRECGTLTNYEDKFIFLTGGYLIKEYATRIVVREVSKYDIKRNYWSQCTSRRGDIVDGHITNNHSTVCLNGKLYLFFGELYEYGVMPTG